MKHLSLTSKTNFFNNPPKSFFALSLFNICLQHFSQNTASFFAATFHTNLQNSSGTLLANRHLQLLCKTALKKSSRTCIFVILPYNFSAILQHFSYHLYHFLFWKLPTSLLNSQQQTSALRGEKNSLHPRALPRGCSPSDTDWFFLGYVSSHFPMSSIRGIYTYSIQSSHATPKRLDLFMCMDSWKFDEFGSFLFEPVG